MRLNKYIALCGVSSRRGADTLIAQNRLTVNGMTVTTMGPDIDPENDVVCLDGVPLCPGAGKVYIMLNKPSGYLCACSDDRGRKTVLDLMPDVGERIYPVGRLDFDTEGLLLLTNDGDFSYRCTHPKHEISKTYFVIVSGSLSDESLDALREGVVLDGVKTSRAGVELIRRAKNETRLNITIHEGRNRQIRRMIEQVGSSVIYLKRIAEGHLKLGGLKTGEWRYLSEQEVSRFDE